MENINPIVLELLKQRGIKDYDEFFSAFPKCTYDPFLLAGMEEGVEKVLEYIKNNKKICIYGDYDADGITSVSIMMQGLSKLTENIFYYIPSRFDEGYGLNIPAIDYIISKGAELILTVDCGSVSFDEIEYAKKNGIEVIVTDHHNIDDRKPDCILINPKRNDCSYPYKEIAGCAVAFKFICAVQRKMNLEKNILREVLDLVAIGTIADVMPVLDENRTFIKYGLLELRKGRRKGLAYLLSELGINQKDITEENLAYSVIPVLNAAGRIKNADLAVKLILGSSDEEIRIYAKELINRNQERKKYQEDAYEKCVNIVDSSLLERNFIMLKCSGVHEGIAGIVAGKLKEKYNRPVVLMTYTGDKLKGTGRSVHKIDLFDIMKEYQSCYEKFGGHFGACGFTMDEKYFDEVSDGLEKSVSEMLIKDPGLFEKEIHSDMNLGISEINRRNYEDISTLAPFGPSNMKPVFEIHPAYIKDVFFMGDNMQHVRFKAFDSLGNWVKCVLFNKAGEYVNILKNSNKAVLIGTLDKQIWKETTSIQLIVKEIK